MSRLIETIKLVDGDPQNINYHFRRIVDSSKAIFGGEPTWQFGGMMGNASRGIWKMRMVYNRTHVEGTLEPYTIRPVRTLKLVTENSIVYNHKFEDRRELEQLYLQREDCDDVLIVKNGVVTDTSYSNIIFRKDDKWVTPSTFLLNGTMRQYMLDTGAISESPISPSELSQFSHFKLINAMLGNEAPESEISNIR